MFSHVMLGANDLEASKKFYDAVLNTLGIGPGVINNKDFFAAIVPVWIEVSLRRPTDQR